jgi:hypothetical protein
MRSLTGLGTRIERLAKQQDGQSIGSVVASILDRRDPGPRLTDKQLAQTRWAGCCSSGGRGPRWATRTEAVLLIGLLPIVVALKCLPETMPLTECLPLTAASRQKPRQRCNLGARFPPS